LRLNTSFTNLVTIGSAISIIVAPNIHSLPLFWREETKIALPSYSVRLINPDSGVTASTRPTEVIFSFH